MTALLKPIDPTKTEEELRLENSKIFDENKDIEKSVKTFSKIVFSVILLFMFAQAPFFVATYDILTTVKFYFVFLAVSTVVHLCFRAFILFFVSKPHNHIITIMSIEEYNRSELMLLALYLCNFITYGYFLYLSSNDLLMAIALYTFEY